MNEEFFKINEDLKKLANEILMKAINNNSKVRIELVSDGVTVSFYQDKVGTLQQVSLYYSNTDGRHDYTILSVRQDNDPEGAYNSGYISIRWKEIRSLKIDSDFYSTTITVDKLKITIKNK